MLRDIFIVANGQILKNNPAIWSHCRKGQTRNLLTLNMLITLLGSRFTFSDDATNNDVGGDAANPFYRSDDVDAADDATDANVDADDANVDAKSAKSRRGKNLPSSPRARRADGSHGNRPNAKFVQKQHEQLLPFDNREQGSVRLLKRKLFN